jgi:hypothetical protein
MTAAINHVCPKLITGSKEGPNFARMQKVIGSQADNLQDGWKGTITGWRVLNGKRVR